MRRRRPRLSDFRTLTLALVGLALAPAFVSAQSPYMVADVGQEIAENAGLFAHVQAEHVVAGGKLYFFQDDGVHGEELWRSDGTPLGTFQIRDLCPGSCGSSSIDPGRFAALGDRLLFAANDGVHGIEFWVTDGSALGTNLVADLVPGFDSSNARLLTSTGDQVFFVAGSPSASGHYRLWRTDGTPKGTYTLEPSGGTGSFIPDSIYVGPGFLYLCNTDWNGQSGLWRSDGTDIGTTFVAPVGCSGSGVGKSASRLVAPDGTFFFQGQSGNSQGLWRSDGTPAGTWLVSGVTAENLNWVAGELLFGVSGLWRSDGTPSGTVEIPLSDGAYPDIYYGSYAVAGDRFFFAAHDATHGTEPWVYHAGVASRIADIAPGPSSSIDLPYGNYSRWSFEAFGDHEAVFLADDGVWGLEVWRTDGTGANTTRISDLVPGSAGVAVRYSWGLYPSLLGGRLTFVDFDAENGDRLWRLNPAGDAMDLVRVLRAQKSLMDPRNADRQSFYSWYRGSLCFESVGTYVLFDHPSAGGTTLLRSDGSLSAPEALSTSPVWTAQECGHQGDRLLYQRSPAQGSVDLLGLDVHSGSSEILIEDGNYVGGFPSYFDDGGRQLFLSSGFWSTDGTSAGTLQQSSTVGIGGGRLDRFGGEVVVAGASLWISDEQESDGFRLLLEYDDFDHSVQPQVAELSDRLVFVAQDVAHGAEIWASDGTGEGTQRLVDGNPGPASLVDLPIIDRNTEYSKPRLVSGGSFAVFPGRTPAAGEELWVTDGSTAGTHLLLDLYPGNYPSSPHAFTRFGDRVFFTAETELSGLELFATDGTVAGTVLVKDIAPGAASSVPDDLVVRDGVLYFSAWNPTYGREAWKSDGTTVGTVRISDIAPGPKSSSPQRFTRAGNRLFFTANDNVHGYELWAISDDGSIPLFLDGFENESTTRWSEVGS